MAFYGSAGTRRWRLQLQVWGWETKRRKKRETFHLFIQWNTQTDSGSNTFSMIKYLLQRQFPSFLLPTNATTQRKSVLKNKSRTSPIYSLNERRQSRPLCAVALLLSSVLLFPLRSFISASQRKKLARCQTLRAYFAAFALLFLGKCGNDCDFVATSR